MAQKITKREVKKLKKEEFYENLYFVDLNESDLLDK